MNENNNNWFYRNRTFLFGFTAVLIVLYIVISMLLPDQTPVAWSGEATEYAVNDEDFAEVHTVALEGTLTSSVIESALGGVLFIDEAYSLYRGEQDSFGLEAIDTLVKGMEDHRDELVVILAGYTKEMETFLTANSGLASRFPNKIEFPDYTADELLQITHVLAKSKGYTLAESCNEPLRSYYARRQTADARTAGNGRLARNTLEKAIFHQSRRLVAEPAAALDVLLPSDLELDE